MGEEVEMEEEGRRMMMGELRMVSPSTPMLVRIHDGHSRSRLVWQKRRLLLCEYRYLQGERGIQESLKEKSGKGREDGMERRRGRKRTVQSREYGENGRRRRWCG